ncbi:MULTISPECIES: class I SAM-dependent methyltransferase [unclassified Sphingomonas]|uniref:class I SAM-dependent methyltransferase n=1 Tax=unclassified Sphingomonas TaxID=196159 RepID=UPI000925856D|nr:MULTISPECIES: class I SAM-dependent methyltransferase [unclassified Sphingomonas]OJU16164.1 MAG: hypothetical protein BGN95_23135 [Sphingomonas sp. 66-10]
MASNAPLDRRNSVIPDIEALARPTLEERGRQRFCSALRRFAIQDMPEMLKRDFDARVKPQRAAKGEALDDALAIERAMKREASYRFYSTLRYNAQEMCFLSVQDSIERALPEMIEVSREAAARNPAGGSLRLDPALEMPRYLTTLDVHLTPGCFHSEWVEDDVAQGAVVSLGARVFSATMSHRSWGGVARVISRCIKHERPDFRPLRILDLGTSSGKNLIPYVEAFPGVEAYGVDLAAPLLRWGHAVAEHEGIKVHFSQQNAEALDFPDGYFDLIVSSFFFHEIPVKATRKVLAECRRLLRPGGMMVHQELPATGLVDAWEDYFWNWDTDNNNEPFYTAFRAQDPIALMEAAGFDRARSFAQILPDVNAYPDRHHAFGWDEPGRPRHGKGGWYVFGSSLPL